MPDAKRHTIIALANRIERVGGSHRAIDWDIAQLLGGHTPILYTGSIDAALTLIPSTWRLMRLCECPDAVWQCAIQAREGLAQKAQINYAATGPLAICAAALRARAEELE